MMTKGLSPATTNPGTTANGRSTEGPCPCGCAPCEERGCDLDCLMQPRFFCGQLLTDADLTALLTWSKEKFRLRRYTAGWGTLCGLQVRCDSKRAAGVIVSPGYALDCCGNDVIICESAHLDLTSACPKPECLDPWEEWEDPEKHQDADKPYGAGLLDELLQNTTVVDVMLHYDEVGSRPQAVIARSACGERGACENSRTQESYRLSWKRVENRDDPQDAAASRWLSPYQKAMRQALDFGNALLKVEDVVEARQRLLDWLARHPLDGLCGFENHIRRMEPGAVHGRLGEWLFWLMLDYRFARLQCDCIHCEENEGIPLARVWLTGDGGCRVVAIHDEAPYRRALRPYACLPAPRDRFNLGRAIGQGAQEAAHILATAGLQITGEVVTMADWGIMHDVLETESTGADTLFARSGERFQAHYIDTGVYGGRRLAWLVRA